MRPREDELIDPEIAEQLDAIDATLAGEPVSPRFAELAELALLLSSERPEGVRPEFAAELDRRVAGRFARDGAKRGDARGGAPMGAVASAGGRRRRWGLAPMLGTAGTALAAVIVAVVLLTAGGSHGTRFLALSASPTIPAHASPTIPAQSIKSATPRTAQPTTVGGTGAGAGAGGARKSAGAGGARGAGNGSTAIYTSPPAAAPVPEKLAPPPNHAVPNRAAVSQGTGAGVSTAKTPTYGAGVGSASAGSINGSLSRAGSASAGSVNGSLSPAPLPNGRKIVQSSMLELGTPPKRIDAVAQEIFEVVRDFNVIVKSSNVSSTGGPGASAQFQLRVPSASLPQALAELSRLPYANVISRTDDTQDVNSPYLSAEREITSDKAALAKLRAKLAAASTVTEITSVRRQIAAENAAISGAESSVTSLNGRVNYSNVDISVQASTGGSSSAGGGFGVGKAGHDALRVLEVTAGVALIALAALVPLALLLALAWWLATTVQRRRRERALDLA